MNIVIKDTELEQARTVITHLMQPGVVMVHFPLTNRVMIGQRYDPLCKMEKVFSSALKLLKRKGLLAAETRGHKQTYSLTEEAKALFMEGD